MAQLPEVTCSIFERAENCANIIAEILLASIVHLLNSTKKRDFDN